MTDREILEKILVRLDSMDNRLDSMDNRLNNLENDVRSVKMTLENDIEPKISDLYSQYITNSDRVSAIEMQVRNNTDRIAINEVINDIKMM